jgi:hypothetical protein
MSAQWSLSGEKRKWPEHPISVANGPIPELATFDERSLLTPSLTPPPPAIVLNA